MVEQSESLFSSIYVAHCQLLKHYLLAAPSLNRPGACRILRWFVLFEQLFCQFNVLLSYLQPHAAGDLGCERMDPVHVLIAQETVYATGVQQSLRDVGLMQVIEDGRRLQLIRVPVLMHATCPGNWLRVFPEKPWCLPS